MMAQNVKPEIEAFSYGNWYLIDSLISKGLLKPPYFVQFVLGVMSAAPPTPWHLLTNTAYAPPNTIFNFLGIGVHQVALTTLAIILGMHVRVGMEDNVYYARGVKAKNNAEFVARTFRIAKELNRSIAAPAEAREMLGISKTPTKY